MLNSIVFHRRSSFVRAWLSSEAGRPSFWAGRVIGVLCLIRFAALAGQANGLVDAGFSGGVAAGSLGQILLSPANVLGLCWVGLAASAALSAGFAARGMAGVIAAVIWAQMRTLGVYGNFASDLILFETTLALWIVGLDGAGERRSFWKRTIYYLLLARVFWFAWPASLAVFAPYFWMSFAAAIIGGRWFRRAHLCVLTVFAAMTLAAGGDAGFALARFALILWGWESGPVGRFKEDDPLGFARHGLLAQGWVVFKVFVLILSLGYAAAATEWAANHFTPAPRLLLPKPVTAAIARVAPARFRAGYPAPARESDWRIQPEVSADGLTWSPLPIRAFGPPRTELTDRLGSYIKGIARLGPAETALLSQLAVRYFAASSPVQRLFKNSGLNPLFLRYAVYQKDPQTRAFTRFAGTTLFPLRYDPSTRRTDWVIR